MRKDPWLDKATRAIEECVVLLERPGVETLDNCTMQLSTAIQCLERFQAGPSAADRGLAPQVLQLRIALGQVNALMRGVAAFHQGWTQAAAAAGASAGSGASYSPEGLAEVRATLRNIDLLG